jgi:hypothetical protein
MIRHQHLFDYENFPFLDVDGDIVVDVYSIIVNLTGYEGDEFIGKDTCNLMKTLKVSLSHILEIQI